MPNITKIPGEGDSVFFEDDEPVCIFEDDRLEDTALFAKVCAADFLDVAVLLASVVIEVVGARCRTPAILVVNRIRRPRRPAAAQRADHVPQGTPSRPVS